MNEARLTPAERLIVINLRHAPGLTAPELADGCQLNRAYILRLLRVLLLTGTITQANGRYTLVAPATTQQVPEGTL